MDTTSKSILRLAIPSVISNITVPLLSLVDIAIVGHIGDAVYLAAISVGTMVFNVMYWVLGFLRMGTSGLTAQALGRKDAESIKWLFSRGLWLGLLLGLSFVVLMYPLRELAMIVMQVGEVTRDSVASYFNICIFGAPAVLGSFALNGWFVGMQNTRIPMRVAIMQNVLNILLSLMFVFVLKMQIPGVALGTLISQWFGFVCLFVYAKRKYPEYSSVKPHVELARNNEGELSGNLFFKVNRNVFLRTLCLVAVNLYFTSAGSAQGVIVLAVNTLLMTYFTLFSYVMDGFAFAGEALGGKHYGAKDYLNLSIVHRKLMKWALLLVVLFTAVYSLGGDAFLSLLTSDSDVVGAAHEYVLYALFIPSCGFLAFIYDGLFIGMTRTISMLISCFVGALVFFAVYFLFFPSLGNDALWIALLSYLMLRGLVLHGIWHFSAFAKSS